MDDGKPAPSKPKQERVKVHEREPMERNCNFEEVEQTMSREEAWGRGKTLHALLQGFLCSYKAAYSGQCVKLQG